MKNRNIFKVSFQTFNLAITFLIQNLPLQVRHLEVDLLALPACAECYAIG